MFTLTDVVYEPVGLLNTGATATLWTVNDVVNTSESPQPDRRAAAHTDPVDTVNGVEYTVQVPMSAPSTYEVV